MTLDIDLVTAAKRMNRTLDRMEQKGGEYHQKVREGFLQLAQSYDHVVAIDGTGGIETVHKKVLEVIEARLI